MFVVFRQNEMDRSTLVDDDLSVKPYQYWAKNIHFVLPGGVESESQNVSAWQISVDSDWRELLVFGLIEVCVLPVRRFRRAAWQM